MIQDGNSKWVSHQVKSHDNSRATIHLNHWPLGDVAVILKVQPDFQLIIQNNSLGTHSKIALR